MTERVFDQDKLKQYYGRILQNTSDLKASACRCNEDNLSHSKQQVISEIFRILRSGGELYFGDVLTGRRVLREFHHDLCCMEWKFTHDAEAATKIFVQNALFWCPKKLSSLIMTWCTYTDPEIAHVGLSLKEAKDINIEEDLFASDMSENHRVLADGVKQFCKSAGQKKNRYDSWSDDRSNTCGRDDKPDHNYDGKWGRAVPGISVASNHEQ